MTSERGWRPSVRELLHPTGPFDFAQMLRRPLSRPSSIAVTNVEDCSYTRAIRLGHRAVPFTVASRGTADAPVLELTYPDDLSAVERGQLVHRIQHMLSAQFDLTAFYTSVAHDAHWARLTTQLYGLRPIQDADLFECMMRTIIGQQLHVKVAATLVERMIALGGDRVMWKDRELPVFPSPETVASWSYEALRARAFSQRKAEYVIDFARLVAQGQLNLQALWSLPDERVAETLLPLRGIGRWTVECFLLFGMARPDILPAADIGIQNAVQKLYALSRRPTESEIRQLATKWAPLRSYATYYLWQSLIPSTLPD